MSTETRLVWDLPLRLFHWLFAASIFASWGAAKFDYMEIHLCLGYWMIGLLAFRVLWGFIGPRHARFSSFIAGPRTVLQYLKGMRGPTVQSVGHNPAGGLMVIVMLLLVAIQAATGLFATDDIIWTGPYNPAVSNAMAERLTAIHHWNFNLILAAIALHLAAIGFYAAVKKHNLVISMLSGTKPATVVPDHEAISSSQLIKALVVILISCALVYWLLHAAPPPPADALG